MNERINVFRRRQIHFISMNNQQDLINNIREQYDNKEIINIISELLSHIIIDSSERRIRETNNENNDRDIQCDRQGRVLRLGDSVQAQTPVRGRYPRGRITGFVNRILQGRPQIYVRFQDENNTSHHRLGRNLLKEE